MNGNYSQEELVTKGRAGTLSHDFDAEIDSILVNPHGKDPKAKGALFPIVSDKTTDIF